ncbi:Hypothetical_protein [Hexamita inflata]|uniref:Hypothetical_protein n=1 Tax=Hexamita inflata TaxID=28002 RepID=A0AA86QL41_9EUKA|nr:Hypothetical protein HINF_LOCUS47863 [Hexamita inflata]
MINKNLIIQRFKSSTAISKLQQIKLSLIILIHRFYTANICFTFNSEYAGRRNRLKSYHLILITGTRNLEVPKPNIYFYVQKGMIKNNTIDITKIIRWSYREKQRLLLNKSILLVQWNQLILSDEVVYSVTLLDDIEISLCITLRLKLLIIMI